MTALAPAAGPDLLVAEPLVRTEIKIGYTPRLHRRPEARTAARRAHRRRVPEDLRGQEVRQERPPPELKAGHAFLDPGDTLVVPSLDRYGRSLRGLINPVVGLLERGIGFTSLHEHLAGVTVPRC